MENPTKRLKVQNKRTRQITSIVKQALPNMGFEFEQIGYERPDDIVPCWYVSEEEKARAIRDQNQFCNDFGTKEYFRMTKRLDNLFIEGYMGHEDQELYFLEDLNTNFIYFNNFKSRKKLYFTFDHITLYEVTEIWPEAPLRFIMKRLDNLKIFVKNQAFMIMPFDNERLEPFYKENIKQVLEDRMGIDTYRANDFHDNDTIIDTIYTFIEQSEIIICDTTYCNKNAFIEYGYAIAKGKEIITVQNKAVEPNLPFDRAHIRAIFYDLNDLGRFHAELESAIDTIRSRQV